MAMCNSCKKHPLEMREINIMYDEQNRELSVCDDCMGEMIYNQEEKEDKNGTL